MKKRDRADRLDKVKRRGRMVQRTECPNSQHTMLPPTLQSPTRVLWAVL